MGDNTIRLKKIKDAAEIVRSLREILIEEEALAGAVKNYGNDEIILTEGKLNENLSIILDGKIRLVKFDENDVCTEVDSLEKGDLMGVVSFFSGEPAFATVQTATPVSLLTLDREQFDRLAEEHPKLRRLLDELIIVNMVNRYRRGVRMRMEIETLSRDLESERNTLKDTLAKLENTHNRLVHQEKMATLGQLVAGIAHEINNPVSALSRGVDNLTEQLKTLLSEYADETEKSLFAFGLESGATDSDAEKVLLDELEKAYPDMERSLLRVIARTGAKGIKLLEKPLKAHKKSEAMAVLRKSAMFFEAGLFIKNVKVSAERIGNLVKGLKSYSRQYHTESELADLRDGIKDTLSILSNRLKKVAVRLNLPALPKVRCQVAEMNQVWTNLIINACDAMEDSAVPGRQPTLDISCGGSDDKAWVKIADNGPGMDEDTRKKIFDPNFTTKRMKGTNFGLGLGLSISVEIIQKHGGRIGLETEPGKGARFTVTLPAAKD